MIPKSVQDQAKRADDLLKAQAGGGKEEGTPTKVEVEPAKAPVVEPAKVEPVAAVSQPVIPVKGSEDFEQKYRVIQGKYNAEIPALQTQVETLTDQVKKFMENKQAEPAKTPENFNEAVKAMEDQYGPEFTEMVNNAAGARAAEIANGIVDERLKDINHRVDTVAETQVQTASEKFYGNLNTGLSNWKTINSDPTFLAWLSKPIDAELGGETYMDKLKAAYNSLNDAMVLTIFNRHLKLNPQAAQDNTSKLEELIVPENQGGGEDLTNLNKEKKTYTQAEVSQFYTDSAAGKYKDRPEEKAQMEADIFAAQSEGRIT
jgi:hypothetical protein